MPRNRTALRRAFTLVELLVVIAIIGVLVALLLPAIQAAREAARRAECKNNLKQIGLSIQNHVTALRTFPSGGTRYDPDIENYIIGGKPVGTESMGLGWGYQILPYLEQGPVHGITTTAQLQQTIISGYVCPSRRPATLARDPLSPALQVTLSDYAATHACGYADASESTRYYPVGVNGQTDSAGIRRDRLFGGSSSTDYIFKVPDNEVYFGAIVRGTKNRNPLTGGTNVTWVPAKSVTSITEMKSIEDGTSNTMLVGEKFVRPDLYEGGSSSDDRGWSDGWDPDTMRSTCFTPMQDSLSGVASNNTLFGASADVLNLGSAHAAGFNTVFCDGSVRTVNYDIDPLALDRLGDRRDGETVDASEL